MGGEFYVERVLTFTRNLNFFLDVEKVIYYLFKEKINADRRGYAK